MHIQIDYRIETLLFIVFVISMLWITHTPMKYFINNIRSGVYDSERDAKDFIERIKIKVNRPIGKVTIIYLIFYVTMKALMFVYN